MLLKVEPYAEGEHADQTRTTRVYKHADRELFLLEGAAHFRRVIRADTQEPLERVCEVDEYEGGLLVVSDHHPSEVWGEDADARSHLTLWHVEGCIATPMSRHPDA